MSPENQDTIILISVKLLILVDISVVKVPSGYF